MLKEYSVETWRTVHPDQYSLNDQDLKKFTMDLAIQTNADEQLLKEATHPNANAAYQVAIHLNRSSLNSRDTICSWLMVGALLGHTSSKLLLASMLAHVSKDFNIFEEDQKKREADKKLRKRQSKAAQYWLQDTPNVLKNLSRFSLEFSLIYDTDMLTDAQNLNTTTSPTLLVLKEIGDASSNEGRSIKKRYSKLLEPLPLSEMPIHPSVLKKALNAEYPWLSNVTETIFNFLKLRLSAGETTVQLPALLLVGPPGCGKTTYIQTLASHLNTGCTILSCSGSSDNRMLNGSARGWSTTQPCGPILAIAQHNKANPMYLVDEIEKSNSPSGARNGSIQATLLNFLEPTSSHRIFDECLLAEVDLSHVSWLATANTLNELQEPLLNRFTVIHVKEPHASHFETILYGIRRKLAIELKLDENLLPELQDGAIEYLKKAFLEGKSLRKLKSAYRSAIASSCDMIKHVHH